MSDAARARWPHTGAILAGGRSVRMGRPKESLALPDGRTVIGAVAEALAQVTRRVVLVGDSEALPDLARVYDLRAQQGPLGGLEALLASGLDTEYLVCPCDVPMVTPRLLHALTGATTRPATVLRIGGEDGTRPLPARVAAAALDAARGHLDRGERAVHRFIAALDPLAVEGPDAWSAELANVNTPEAYAALLKKRVSPPVPDDLPTDDPSRRAPGRS